MKPKMIYPIITTLLVMPVSVYLAITHPSPLVVLWLTTASILCSGSGLITLLLIMSHEEVEESVVTELPASFDPDYYVSQYRISGSGLYRFKVEEKRYASSPYETLENFATEAGAEEFIRARIVRDYNKWLYDKEVKKRELATARVYPEVSA